MKSLKEATTTQLDKDVEKRFDEQFYRHFHSETDDFYFTESEIKQFLAKELAAAKEEGAREFAQMVNDRVLIKGRCIEKHGGQNYQGSMSILNIFNNVYLPQLTNSKKDK